MKRIFMIFILFVTLLIACSKRVTEKDLIGGTWEATAGFEDGEAKGEPYCKPFEKGLEFKDDETVYVTSHDKDFDYWIEENEGDYIINFYRSHTYQRYYISLVNDEEMGITAKGDFMQGASCYFERK